MRKLTESGGNDSNLALSGSGLGNGVVNGNGLKLGPDLLEDRLAGGLVIPDVGNLGKALVDVGAVLLDELHEGGSLGDEHTGVPAVLTRGDVLGGGVSVGLLLEGVDDAGAASRLDSHLLAELDVTEAGSRVRRRDTNSNEVTFLGDLDSLSDGAEESLLTGNHVIGGERTKDGLGIALGEDGGSQTNGSHRVLGSGLGEQVGAFELRKLALDGVGVGRAGDDGHARGTGEGHQTVPG